jgi:GT2 family glycosyltransferase
VTRPVVSILVVTYKCLDEARECFAALYERVRHVSFEVVAVDNASADGTVEALRAEFPQVRLLALPENVGFARAVNRAAQEAQGEFLLLLNPDAVVHEDAVERLVEFARANPGYGLYAGRNLNPDGTVFVNVARGRPTLWSLFCFATMLSTGLSRSRLFDPESLGGWERDTVRQVDTVIGSFLLVPRAFWEEQGGFDPRFFMYGEDVDLSLRAAKAGRPAVLVPEAAVTHEVGASSENRPDRMALVLTGKVTVLRKHWPPWKRRIGVAMLWFGVGVRALLALATRRSVDEAGAMWPGVWRARRRWLTGYPDPGKSSAAS